MKYTSVLGLLVTLTRFVFQWFNSCYRSFLFHLCIILYNFLVCNLYVIYMFYVRVSIGLTDKRKTAKNLVDSRKN